MTYLDPDHRRILALLAAFHQLPVPAVLHALNLPAGEARMLLAQAVALGWVRSAVPSAHQFRVWGAGRDGLAITACGRLTLVQAQGVRQRARGAA